MITNSITDEYYKNTDLLKRKKYGQYMTNYNIIDCALKDIKIKKSWNILEPTFGSGQFIDKIDKGNIEGIEIDKELYEMVSKKYKNNNNVKLFNSDFFEYKFNKKYDLIIGNPPYFEFKPIDTKYKEFKNLIVGRANIYTLVLKKCIDLLKENGILIFVIPTSLLSSRSFEKIRKYIIETCNIDKIVKLDPTIFTDALQETMIFQISKFTDKNNNKFIVNFNDYIIFSENYLKINEIIKDKKFIKDYNCKVKTGSIVWNQLKDKLSKESKNPVLIYARNLIDSKIVLSDDKNKFQYLNLPKPEKQSVIAINRIIGVKSINLNPVLIKDAEYYYENHVNIIIGDYINLKIIYDSLIKPETIEFIRMIAGNTQLSQFELENLIPVFSNNKDIFEKIKLDIQIKNLENEKIKLENRKNELKLLLDI